MQTIKQVLSSWLVLNAELRVADEERCRKLLLHEKETKRRLNYMLRIYGRYNRLRSDRERREL